VEPPALSSYPVHCVFVSRLVQVFLSTLGNLSLGFQLGPGLPPLEYPLVLFRVDVQRLFLQEASVWQWYSLELRPSLPSDLHEQVLSSRRLLLCVTGVDDCSSRHRGTGNWRSLNWCCRRRQLHYVAVHIDQCRLGLLYSVFNGRLVNIGLSIRRLDYGGLLRLLDD